MSNKITLSDVRKQIAISSNNNSPDMEIKLCYSGKTILVKPLKVKEKKELLKSLESKNEILVNRVLDEIIQSYVVTQDDTELDTKTLTIQERHQILVYIRAANGDEVVKIAHQCPSCNKVTRDIPYELSKKSYVKDFDHNGAKKVVTICSDAVEINYDVLFRNEEIEVEEYIKEEKLKTVSERQFVMVAASIKDIFLNDGTGRQRVENTTLEEKMEFIEELDTKEFNVISSAISELDFGVKMPFDFKCSHCEYESKEEVNATVFFIS